MKDLENRFKQLATETRDLHIQTSRLAKALETERSNNLDVEKENDRLTGLLNVAREALKSAKATMQRANVKDIKVERVLRMID